MQTLGERLEESRKRQGISIRDAAEATKIRADFLLDFENNRFDQNLPDLYKRGFIKVYAKFLKMDTDKLTSDFEALQISYIVPTAKNSLGRVEVSTNYVSTYSDDAANTGEGSEGIDATIYWKIGIALAVFAVGVGLLVLLINFMSPDDADDTGSPIGSEMVSSADGDTPDGQTTPPADTGPRTITLIGIGDCHVRVRDSASQKTLFGGALTAGQRVPIEITGKVEIVSTEMQNIQLEKDDGTYITPDASGLGKFFFDDYYK